MHTSTLSTPYWMLVVAIALVGCNANSLPSGAAAVEGNVTYDGVPVEGATVTFRSKSGFAAVGKTNAEGVYHLSSSKIPGGTEPGSYTITVVKREAAEGGSLTEDDPNYKPNASAKPVTRKHLLPEKYSKPTTSELTREVEAGSNLVNLELTK
ncbi:carboxypeptidase-like regulatory domain-containing protein [Bremerella cremea]|uniref:carboxypeptidase-like regulatory domain-containing protein n=1 Tax=Bremerella cremea TaxID=1031537 RepID=UPI0031E598BE